MFGFTPSVRMRTFLSAMPSVPSNPASCEVFGASYSSASMTMIASSRARALSALFRASARTFRGTATFSRAAPFAVYAAAFMVVVSAISLCLLLHEYDAVRRTGHRPADVDQIALGIDTLDPKMSLRMPLVAVLARHLLALDHARRIGAWADRARAAMLRVAVSVRTAVEAMT